METKSSNVSTYLLVMVVMIAWGLNVVFLKILVEAFPPVTMTAFRILTAGVVVGLVVLCFRKFKRVTKSEWKNIGLGAIFGVVAHHAFLSQGLSLTTASNAVLILALLPLTTSLLAAMMLKDKLSPLRIVGIIFALIGVSLIILMGSSQFGKIEIGDLFILMAMFVQALSFIYIKRGTNTLDSKQMTAMMLLIGSIGLFLVSFFFEPQTMSVMYESTTWLLLAVFLCSAIGATAIGHILYNEAIHKLGAGETAIFNNFVPFFGLIFSALFLGEEIRFIQLFGFVFIIIGVLFGTGYVDEKRRKRLAKKQQVFEKTG
ncbi:DMT family transporter [Alkalihalobacterium bogoriense]|uniref:DMT family transporter n=1 Tax=Alkalihalobacterium bogoriense TaxID=246272 RepID=UPI0005592995|nr:DMT family transporter [Alkalihalobacterium bogoriense]